MIRRQLAVSSPVRIGSVARAGFESVVRPGEAKDGLERSLAARFAARDVVLTGSGTDALTLALTLSADDAGRPALVALPAYSCFDIVTAAVGADVRVVFYDVDPVHLGPVPDSLDRALGLGARVAVVGNLHGYPVAWDRVRTATDAAGALLIEDAAQGVGSLWRGVSGGCFGDATVLSFGRGKGWTGGGGGALLFRSDRCDGWKARTGSMMEAPGSLSSSRAFLGLVAQWLLGRPWLYGIPSAIPSLALGETVYKEPRVPLRMSPLVAATVAALEAVSDARLSRRIETAERWSAVLGRGARLRPLEPEQGGLSAFLRLAALADTRESAERLGQACEAAGLARGYPITLPRLPAVAGLVDHPLDMPGAETLASRLVTLPTHSMVSDTDVRAVGRAVGG